MIEKDYYNGWNDEGNLNKILSCPFCGGNGELLDNGYEHPVIDENGAYVDMDIFEGDTFWIECEKCGAMMTGADTPEKAIEEWNKRTGSGWIPVEERLPEESEEFNDRYDPVSLAVIDTEWHKESDVVQITVHDKGKEEYLISADYTYDGEWAHFGGMKDTYDVIAWKPLSEPYIPEEIETRKELERSEGE